MNRKLNLSILIINLLSHLSIEEAFPRSPPMGYNSWTAFRCQVDCTTHPTRCINEMLYQEMADIMAVGGYKDAGYKYVNIDDCWMERERDRTGKLVANRTRFPDGIKGLADFMHRRGLKLGLYEDVGAATCAGYPGSFGHYRTDAQTFAEWNIDYIKIDGCNLDPELLEITHLQMKKALENTKHTMVYSCEWPFYIWKTKKMANYTTVSATCNIWRNFVDMRNNWREVRNIVNYMVLHEDEFARVQRPGAFNDPDMLAIGNRGINVEMAKTQMTIWCIWSVPLFISTDLRKLEGKFKDILLNKEAISVNQDSMVKFGKVVKRNGDLLYFVKPINPIVEEKYSYAVAIVNMDDKNGTEFNVEVSELGLNDVYEVHEIWSGRDMGKIASKDWLSSNLPPAGSLFFKFVIANKYSNRTKLNQNVIS